MSYPLDILEAMNVSLGFFIVIIGLSIVCGAALGWAFAAGHHRAGIDAARAEADSARAAAQQSREQLLIAQGQQARLEDDFERLAEKSREDSSLLTALAPIRHQLADVDRYVRSLDTKNAEQFARIAQQLANDAKVTVRLASTADSLSAAMTNSSARGSWGEIQLRRVIEAAGMLEHVDFNEQKASAGFAENASDNHRSGRPDVLIHLPGGGHIAIDSKVPMSSYLQAMEISPSDLERSAERHQHLAAHAKAVRSHINALVKRNYPADFPHSPQLTIMFLPAESLLSQAVDSDVTVLEDALTSGVIPASPATLLALLRSIAAVWRSESASAEATQIVAVGRELVDRLSIFVDHLTKLGKTIQGSVKAYNSAMASLESRVLVSYRKFNSLGQKAHELHAPEPISSESGQIREITAPEL
ncbi:DNA recombination protein RmuC [Arcanobacterium canis]